MVRKSPIGRPFRKGQSGNPAGRPKAVADIRDLAKQHGPAAIEILFAIAQNGKTPAAARVSAATAILDRGYGRPVQPLVGDEDSPPIWLSVEDQRRKALATIEEAFREVVPQRMDAADEALSAAALARPAPPMAPPAPPDEMDGSAASAEGQMVIVRHRGAMAPPGGSIQFADRSPALPWRHTKRLGEMG